MLYVLKLVIPVGSQKGSSRRSQQLQIVRAFAFCSFTVIL